MNLLAPTGPPPTSAAGEASHAEVRHTINTTLPGAELDQIVALAWRRPAAAAQIIHQLATITADQKRQIDHQHNSLLDAKAERTKLLREIRNLEDHIDHMENAA